MFLLRYLKPINGLPDLRGSLSTMSREAIAAANRPEGAKYHKKKNVANTRSLHHSVLLSEGTALGMEQLPLCDNPSHKTLSETPPALWCALISRMYDRVRVCAACALYGYIKYFSTYTNFRR